MIYVTSWSEPNRPPSKWGNTKRPLENPQEVQDGDSAGSSISTFSAKASGDPTQHRWGRAYNADPESASGDIWVLKNAFKKQKLLSPSRPLHQSDTEGVAKAERLEEWLQRLSREIHQKQQGGGWLLSRPIYLWANYSHRQGEISQHRQRERWMQGEEWGKSERRSERGEERKENGGKRGQNREKGLKGQKTWMGGITGDGRGRKTRREKTLKRLWGGGEATTWQMSPI